MKFDLSSMKAAGKQKLQGYASDGAKVALLTGGVIAGQKFLDFRTLFKEKKETDFLIKYEGLIKIGAALTAIQFIPKMPPAVKWLLLGVAIQGGIKQIRQFDSGKAFVEQIGNSNDDEMLRNAAAEILAAGRMNGMQTNPTTEFETSVAGMETISDRMARNSATSVAGGAYGMGMDNNNGYPNNIGFQQGW